MINPKRLFIAIVPTGDIQRAIFQSFAHLHQRNLGVKWVAQSQLHLTLKFFGDVDENQMEPLTKAIGEAVKSFAPFELAIDQWALFPEGRPHVVVGAVGATHASPLRALAERIHRATAPWTFQEREFQAHLTVGRLRDGAAFDATLLRGIPLPPPWTVNEITLYQSALTPNGPIYQKLETFPLR